MERAKVPPRRILRAKNRILSCFGSGRSSVSSQTTVSLVCDEIEDLSLVRLIFADPGERSQQIGRQIVRHTVVYGQIYEIFCCLKGSDVRVAFGEGLSFVDNDKASAHPDNDELVFGIHLVSQGRVLRSG